MTQELLEKYVALISEDAGWGNNTSEQFYLNHAEIFLILGSPLKQYIYGRCVLGKFLDESKLTNSNSCLKLSTPEGDLIALTRVGLPPVFFYDPIEIIEKSKARHLIVGENEHSDQFLTVLYGKLFIGYSILFKTLSLLTIDKIPKLLGTILTILELGGYYCPLLCFSLKPEALNLKDFYDHDTAFDTKSLDYFCLRSFRKINRSGVLAQGEHQDFIKKKSKATSLFNQFKKLNGSKSTTICKKEVDKLAKLIQKRILENINVDQCDSCEVLELALDSKVDEILSDHSNIKELYKRIGRKNIKSLSAKQKLNEFLEDKMGKKYNAVTFALQYSNIVSKITETVEAFENAEPAITHN